MDMFTYQNRNGVKRVMMPHDKDTFTVHTQQNCDDIVDSCKRDAELFDPHATNKVLARIPMAIYERSMVEEWDDEDWKRWLNDGDNKAFRIWPGRV